MNTQQTPGGSHAPITAILLVRHPGGATAPQGRSHAGSREDTADRAVTTSTRTTPRRCPPPTPCSHKENRCDWHPQHPRART